MKTRRLALRVVLNSVVMLLGVYLIMQFITYFRDNMLLGIGDLSAMLGSVMTFIVFSVMPPIIVFGVAIYILALQIQRVERRLIAGEKLDEQLIEKTRKRIQRFPAVVLGINLAGFTLGFILSLILTGQLNEIFYLNNFIVLCSNLAGGTVYAWAQSSLNNLAFGPLLERLGIHSIGDRKRTMRSTVKQVLLGSLMAFYVLTFYQLNLHDISTFQELEGIIIAKQVSGEIAPDKAGEEWRKTLGEKMNGFSRRSIADLNTVPLPWERPQKMATIEQDIFLMYFIFLVLIATGIQFTVSVDMRDQLRAIQVRIKDVVTGGGDLRKRLSLRNMDDLGELTELINQLLEQFQGIVGRITGAAGQTRQGAAAIDAMLRQAEVISSKVGQSVLELRQDLETQAKESRELTAVLTSFRSASAAVHSESETQRSHVSDTSVAMDEMAQGIQIAEDRTRQAGKLTEGLAIQGQVGGKAMLETTQAINEIETAAKQVLKVVGALNKVAAETNLLAMNAAIEAAHAGEHGSGFAIVADEVRKLSNNAAAQTQAIRELIKTMALRVSQGVDRSKASSEILTELVKGLTDSAAVSAELARSMDEQGTRSRSVSESLGLVVGTSDTIRDRMQAQNRETERMAQTLENTLARIATLVDASNRQAAEVQVLNESFIAVRREVDQNTKAVDALDSEIGRFQV